MSKEAHRIPHFAQSRFEIYDRPDCAYEDDAMIRYYVEVKNSDLSFYTDDLEFAKRITSLLLRDAKD